MIAHSPTPPLRVRGFSLVELAVTVAVIAILAAVAIPVFLGNRKGAQDSVAISSLENVTKVARAAAANNDGLYPDLASIKPDEPAITISEDPSTGPLEVAGLINSGQVATFAALSESGTCFVVTSPLNAQETQDSYEVDLDTLEPPCGGVLALGELVILSVELLPNGDRVITWEPDPAADGYEVCDGNDNCEVVHSNTYTASPGQGQVTIRKRCSAVSCSSGANTVEENGGIGNTASHPNPPHTPPPPVDDPEDGGSVGVTQEGNVARLVWEDTGTGAETYEIRRCTGAGCTNGLFLAAVPTHGGNAAGTYQHDDDLTGLIAEGVEVVGYQVVVKAGPYTAASNWAYLALESDDTSPQEGLSGDWTIEAGYPIPGRYPAGGPYSAYVWFTPGPGWETHDESLTLVWYPSSNPDPLEEMTLSCINNAYTGPLTPGEPTLLTSATWDEAAHWTFEIYREGCDGDDLFDNAVFLTDFEDWPPTGPVPGVDYLWPVEPLAQHEFNADEVRALCLDAGYGYCPAEGGD